MQNRITIRRDARANCYTATMHDDHEVRRLFGTETLPTPYTLKADPLVVVADVQSRNPRAVVTFIPESL
jgi:hypothetical protein